ncbi:MAG: cell surface protein, partial [Bacteroidota bacterium]
YKSGDKLTAMKYAKGYVYRKTFEPDALLHTAFIFADNGKKEEAKVLLKECLQSSFELGPVATAAVREKLASL